MHMFCILLYSLGNIFEAIRIVFTVYQRTPIFSVLNESSNFESIETFVKLGSIWLQINLLFQATLLDFGWRNAFKEVSLPMAHCINTTVEDISSKILEEEQSERSSSVSYVMNLVNVQQVWKDNHVFPEEEQPKKIAKASTNWNPFKLLLCRMGFLFLFLF